MRQKEEEQSFAVSFADLMSGLVLTVILLLCLTLLKHQNDQKALIGVEEEIIKALESELKSVGQVEVLKSGEVRIGESFLFDRNQAVLKPMGKQKLSELIPKYAKVLFGTTKYSREIERVTIEGHASPEGEEKHNMKLSQERAFAVYSFIASLAGFEYQKDLLKVLEAVGRGINQPVLSAHEAKPDPDHSKHRRVEIKFSLRWKTKFKELVGGKSL